MLNITNHQRCKWKPQWNITSHLSEWPSLINQQTSAGKDVEKREPFSMLVGMQICAATEKAVWSYLKKFKMELPYNLVIPLWEIYTKKPETLIWNNTNTPMFTAALFIIAKIWKQPKCPSVDEWIKQLWDIYTMEYFSAVKKKILPFATVWRDLKNIMLSEISQSEKDKHHMITCGI